MGFFRIPLNDMNAHELGIDAFLQNNLCVTQNKNTQFRLLYVHLKNTQPLIFIRK